MAKNDANIDAAEDALAGVVSENIAEDAAAIGDAATGAVEQYGEILMTGEAYSELIAIAFIIATAWLVGVSANALIRKRCPKWFESGWAWLLRPLKLLPALLAIIGLNIVTPMIVEDVGTPHFLHIAIQVNLAWIMIKLTFMLVGSRLVAWLISSMVIAGVTLGAFDLLEPTMQLLQGIGVTFGETNINLLGVLKGMVLCIVLFWLAFALSGRIEKQLSRSSLSYSIRTLLTKFFKILLFTLAIMVTLSAIGVDLTALAVLGGALGVGIGFGLQTITSNFISGIILLIDKSIKQGDLIEVSGVEGYVRRLNIRSTTIETFSGQEVTVPNETLITSNLTNFTMNNRRARVEIHVGVAYGSDYALVKELLLKAAISHPRCMSEPKPACYMREFADSSVNFRVQFWVADVVEGRLGPQSDVMFEITRLFDEHSIEIPFPQRDVNLRQMGSDPQL